MRTPTSVTPGKSCPLATICVPTSTSSSRRAKRARTAAACPGPPAASRSRRATRACGTTASSCSSTFSVPPPNAVNFAAPHAAHSVRGASSCPQRWQRSRSRPARCSTRATEQLGHPTAEPHPAQISVRVWPRRLRKRIACSPRPNTSRSADDSSGVSSSSETRRRMSVSAGRRARVHPLRQAQRAQLALVRPAQRLERRRGAAQHAHRARLLRPHQRKVARVVAEPVLLLERGVVLLVDDDDAQVARPVPRPRCGRPPRCRPRRSRTRRHIVAALALGEAGVEHRDVVAEARAEAADELRRERDLRHQHQRAPPARGASRDGCR